MMFIRVDLFQNIAIGGMIVVSMAVLSSMTLLPSVLLRLGIELTNGKLLKVKANGSDRWRKFAKWVIKRPVIITIVAIILLGIAVIPVKNMDLAIPQIDSLPESYDSRQAFELIEREFDLADTIFRIFDRRARWRLGR